MYVTCTDHDIDRRFDLLVRGEHASPPVVHMKGLQAGMTVLSQDVNPKEAARRIPGLTLHHNHQHDQYRFVYECVPQHHHDQSGTHTLFQNHQPQHHSNQQQDVFEDATGLEYGSLSPPEFYSPIEGSVLIQ